jgi:hypothetical protein
MTHRSGAIRRLAASQRAVSGVDHPEAKADIIRCDSFDSPRQRITRLVDECANGIAQSGYLVASPECHQRRLAPNDSSCSSQLLNNGGGRGPALNLAPIHRKSEAHRGGDEGRKHQPRRGVELLGSGPSWRSHSLHPSLGHRVPYAVLCARASGSRRAPRGAGAYGGKSNPRASSFLPYADHVRGLGRASPGSSGWV